MGRAHAAVSVLNGTLCGIGCSVAVTGGVAARWQDAPDRRVHGAPDERVVQAAMAHLGVAGGHVRIESTFPPSRGLKTSSGAAAALLRAGRRALGMEPGDVVADGVAVCRAAGVTVTGAMDDQMAVTHGGMHLCDVSSDRVLASWAAPAWEVWVWVPEAAIPKERLPRAVPSAVQDLASHNARRLERHGAGAAPDVLAEVSGALVSWYSRHLTVDDRAARVAHAHGARGAGLTGTGPAVAALFAPGEAPASLSPVAGGAWHHAVAVSHHPEALPGQPRADGRPDAAVRGQVVPGPWGRVTEAAP